MLQVDGHAERGEVGAVPVPERIPAGVQLDTMDREQTSANLLAADLPALARMKPSTMLYADVDSLAVALAAVPGAELLVPERKASYGPKEAAVRTASGHVVLFAEET